MPNRFEVRFESEQQAIDAANQATEAFHLEWNAICDQIWRQYIQPVADQFSDCSAHEVWRRQTRNFWELAWVATAETDQNQLAGLALKARKYCRWQRSTTEPGTKVLADERLPGSVWVLRPGSMGSAD